MRVARFDTRRDLIFVRGHVSLRIDRDIADNVQAVTTGARALHARALTQQEFGEIDVWRTTTASVTATARRA